MSAASKSLCSISHVMQILDFPVDGAGYLLYVPPSISSSLGLGSGGGGRYGLLNAAKTWKTTRMNIDRPILVFLKEKCFLPSFSRTCTAKVKSVLVNKQLRLLQHQWILNQVGSRGRKSCKKSAPTAKSVKNHHVGPARIP